MCGILAYTGKERDISSFVFDCLRSLEYRGYDSWGIVAAHEGRTFNVREVGKLGEMPPTPFLARFALGHTRWATTGAVNAFNAHPHVDCAHSIALVHNGIVENFETLRKRLIQKGHRFTSDTDSEVIAHLIEEKLDTTDASFIEAVRSTAQELKGLNAFVALKMESGEIAASKTGSPLYVGFGEDTCMVASDVGAFMGEAKEYVRIADGESIHIAANTARLYKTATGESLPLIRKTLTWGKEASSLGTYRHYLEKEIAEQPDLLRHIAQESEQRLAALRARLASGVHTLFIGCGTANHAGLYGTYLFARQGLRSRSIFPHELEFFIDSLSEQDLVIALSQSGETIDLLDAIRHVNERGIATAAIVNVPNSSLTYEVPDTLLIGAGPERSVLSTKAFASTLGYLMALSDSGEGAYRQHLQQSATVMDEWLTPKRLSMIESVAVRIAKCSSIFLLGSGELYPIALEAALKIKEVSYIHAEGFAAGELKHGVIALIDEGTPCIIFVPQGQQRARALIAAHEVKSRGAFVIGVSAEKDPIFDIHLPVPAEGESFALATILPMQLLAYHLALVKKLDPDKPRNLAKTVTVR